MLVRKQYTNQHRAACVRGTITSKISSHLRLVHTKKNHACAFTQLVPLQHKATADNSAIDVSARKETELSALQPKTTTPQINTLYLEYTEEQSGDDDAFLNSFLVHMSYIKRAQCSESKRFTVWKMCRGNFN